MFRYGVLFEEVSPIRPLSFWHTPQFILHLHFGLFVVSEAESELGGDVSGGPDGKLPMRSK